MTAPNTSIHNAAATVLRLVRSALSDPDVDSGEITRAAVAVMDRSARPSDDDDLDYVQLADNLAERAALWAYGLRDNDFRRG